MKQSDITGKFEDKYFVEAWSDMSKSWEEMGVYINKTKAIRRVNQMNNKITYRITKQTTTVIQCNYVTDPVFDLYKENK